MLYFAENGCFGGKISIRSHFEKPRAPIFGIVGVQVFILFIYFDFSSEVNKYIHFQGQQERTLGLLCVLIRQASFAVSLPLVELFVQRAAVGWRGPIMDE